MSLGSNIAAGLASAVVFRWLANTALASTAPPVDPAMPMAGPVLVTTAVPVIPAALLYKKHPTIASVLAGIGVGAGVATAEYMSFAKDAQGASATYTWNVGYDDGTVNATIGPVQATAAQVADNDALVLSFYKGNPHVVSIERVGSDGSIKRLLDRAPKALPANQGTPILVQQSSGAFRRGYIR